MDLNKVKEIAVEAALEAGEILRNGIDAQKNIGRKSSAVDLVTEYDHRAEAIIVRRVKELFPDHQIIAEEGDSNQGAETSDFTWYIDPLDGTNNFSHGLPVFAVSIALYQQGKPLVGVVYDPMRNECFQAVRGQGAFLQSTRSLRPLTVSPRDQLVESLLATGFPYDRHNSSHDNVKQFSIFLKRSLGVRRAGSASLDMAYVAAARLDGYWEYKLSSWDIAAGLLLVQEAGGMVTGMDGRDLLITPNISLVASNGLIHSSMVSALSEGETVS